MGPVAKQVRKRVGTLSVKLHELFHQYIASGKIPSVKSLKKAKFKFRPGKCYAYGLRKRASSICVVSGTSCSEADKLMCPKVYAEGFVLERFRAWAKRMKVSQDDNLVFVGNDKIIIPKEHFPDLVRKVHTKDGANGLKHRSFVKTLKVLRKMYSIGRRQFGVSPQFVKKIVQYCTDEKCSAKQYKLRRNRGMLTDGYLSGESPSHSSESDIAPESPSDDDTETNQNVDTGEVVNSRKPFDRGSNDVQTDDPWKHDSGNSLSDFHHELFSLAPKYLSTTQHEAECGFSSNRSLAVMLDSEQSMRDDAPQHTPPGKCSSRAAAHKDRMSHDMDYKTCRKSADKTSDVHKVCAPLWIPPAPQAGPMVHTQADKKSLRNTEFPKRVYIGVCTKSDCLPKSHGSTPEPNKSLRQPVVSTESKKKGKEKGKGKVQPTGNNSKANICETSVESVQANMSASVAVTKTSGFSNQQDGKKIAINQCNSGVIVTTHTKKFGNLMDVIRQMKMDIGPACANNQMALERLKRKIHIGLSVLTECRCLLHNYEEMHRSATSHFK